MVIHGEIAWFWVDLSANSHLIDGNFNSATATPTGTDCCYYDTSTPNISEILPIAKIGNNNFISVVYFNGNNYFVLSKIKVINGDGTPTNSSKTMPISTKQAYDIDTKIDDGFPQTGKVVARYVNSSIVWPGIAWAAYGGGGTADTAATPASATTCYDNGNVAGATQQYSVGTNGGNGLNCALSFQFQ
jgi:hypothetical protein